MAVLEIFSSQNHSAEHSHYWWKILIISGAGLIFSILSGFGLGKVFAGGNFLGFSAFGGFLIFLSLFLIFFILEGLVGKGARFGGVFLQSLAFVLGYYFAKSDIKLNAFIIFWNVGVLLILILCLWVGRLIMRKRKEDLLRLRWNEMTKGGLALMLVGVNLFICLQWVGNVIIQPDFLFSQKTVDVILKPATPIVRLYFKDFKWNMTVDEFIKNLITEQVEAMFQQTKGELSQLPTSYIENQKKILIQQNATLLKTQLSNWLKIQLSGNEAVDIVVFQFLLNKYRALDVQIKQFIILFIAAIMFLLLRMLAIVFSWVVRLIGWLIYEIFISANFVVITTETRNKENLLIY